MSILRKHPSCAAFTLIAILLVVVSASAAQEPEVMSVKKIWDQAPHNAFTDLARWQDAWWCTFREGNGHVGGDGAIRVITSDDGEEWASAALLTLEGVDLRDPKISVTPDNRLMLLMGGSVYEGEKFVTMQPRVTFSEDGSTWSELQKAAEERVWLWRATWHEGTAYGVSYGRRNDDAEWRTVLWKSADGLDWERVAPFEIPGSPSEASLRFMDDGRMVAMVRQDGGDGHGRIGVSSPPYADWTWSSVEGNLGGPAFIILPGGAMWGASRIKTDEGSRTALARMTLDSYDVKVVLPSGGDTSYPGLVWHDGLLWMSYYSSHEGKTSIYLAKIDVDGEAPPAP